MQIWDCQRRKSTIMNETYNFDDQFVGFSARLKLLPSDFKVVELDEHETPCYHDPSIDTCEKIQNNCLRKELPMTDCSDSYIKKHSFLEKPDLQEIPKRKKPCTSSSSSVNGSSLTLNEPNCQFKLSQLLSQKSTDWLKEQQKNNDMDTKTYLLGKFDDKNERMLVHKCVRYLYPHLSSLTHNNEIHVEMCLKFQYFSKLMGTQNTMSFIRYACVYGREDIPREFNITGNFSKDERRLIHRGIDNYFGKFLMSKTRSNGKVIEVKRKPLKRALADTTDQYCKFVLYKCNIETFDAIQQLSKYMGSRPHNFDYAGTKDKRAQTWQWMTIKGKSVNELKKVVGSLPSCLGISDVSMVSSSLRLGQLRGNRFKLILRNVSVLRKRCNLSDNEEEKEIEVENLKRDIEKSLQLFKKTAVNILLQPGIGVCDTDEKSNPDNKAKQYLFETGDIEGTIKNLHSSRVRELSILRALRKFVRNLKQLQTKNTDQSTPRDDDTANSAFGAEPHSVTLSEALTTQAYVKALLSLPHNILTFYVHAYCSLIWNKVAAARLRHFGSSVIEGDLVMCKDNDEVKIVDASDIEKDVYQFDDVILPLPGNRVRFPPALERFYLETMSLDGVVGNKENLNSVFRINQLRMNIPGTYRRIMEYPRNLRFNWSPNDMEKSQILVQHSASSNPPSTADVPSTSSNHGVNLNLTFDLRPSCYATTFLKQLSKDGLIER